MALWVAFGSSSLRHSTEGELVLLRRQVDRLRQDNQDLQEKIRWTEGRYAQSLALGKRLNEALLQEQQRNRSLASNR